MPVAVGSALPDAASAPRLPVARVELTRRLRDFGRRRRAPITVIGSLLTAALLVLLLAGRRDEFTQALSNASLWVLAAAALLQIVALLARSEAWHLTIEAAGGSVAAPGALPRVERAGAGQLHQRPAGRGRPDSRAAALLPGRRARRCPR